MSRLLELELDDKVYATIQRRAQAAGTSPTHWIRQLLETQCLETFDADHTRIERHFGTIDSHDATAADNACIDADIAWEYADNHESS